MLLRSLKADSAAHPPQSPSVASVASVPPSVSGSAASVASSVSGSIIPRLIAAPRLSGRVTDLRIGAHWTIVVAATERGPRAGLSATQVVHDLEHGRPAVRNAGRLIGSEAHDLLGLAQSASPTERSIGFATINALLQVDESACTELNAEQLILARGHGRRVAIVGHFPFVPAVREAAAACWVLELDPRPGDLPAGRASEIIPQADVVAMTGQTLVNETFEGLAALVHPEAYCMVLGATTPLSRVLFDYPIDAISGTILTDIPGALAAVSQGANFRQIPGKRLVTMTR